MKRTVTLKNNYEFHRLYGKGKSFKTPALVLYVMKNRVGICRVGITTSKKIGNAVERSRCRRVIRAAYRELEPKITGNFDFVFVARSKTKYVKSTDLEKTMFDLFCQAGVISV